jgi:hypothetical protein
MISNNTGPFVPGMESIPAEWLQEMLNVCRAIDNASAMLPIKFDNNPSGYHWSSAESDDPKKPFRVRITAVAGSFPVWSYTVQKVTGFNSANVGYLKWVTDGRNITGVLNTFEFAPQSGYPYIHGTGVSVTASDGTVDGGSCRIIPIGVGAVVEIEGEVDENGDIVYSFGAPNSAEAP